MKKTEVHLEYVLNLEYETVIEKISEEDGGGYCAYLPDFGHHVIFGDGDTKEEALSSMESFKEHQFTRYLELGIAFPEPAKRPQASGKFLLRLPKGLHGQLIHGAGINGTTLNQYCVSLLSMNYSVHNIRAQIESVANRVAQMMYKVDAVTEQDSEYSVSGYDDKNTWRVAG